MTTAAPWAPNEDSDVPDGDGAAATLFDAPPLTGSAGRALRPAAGDDGHVARSGDLAAGRPRRTAARYAAAEGQQGPGPRPLIAVRTKASVEA